MDNPYLSSSFYQYLCDVIGSEEVVSNRRRIFAAYDYVNSCGYLTFISSGSKAEGLDLGSSDLDMMELINPYPVYESKDKAKPDHEYTALVMDAANCKPGFTLLKRNHKLQICCFCEYKARMNANAGRKLPESFPFLRNTTGHQSNYALIHQQTALILDHHFEYVAGEWYLSSAKVRDDEILKDNNLNLITHGPCNSTPDGAYDLAMCVRCKDWIRQGQSWIYRIRNSWASKNVIDAIIEFGVLFVPVGCKSSPNKDLEWRISFSYAERLLIWSFNHVQLMCYALLKILLKDIIKEITGDLLCSYFLKTVMFWICEETESSQWKETNLLCCFMSCLDRLIYCVQYKTCLHYFIPENDLFAERFSKKEHTELMSTLKQLRSLGWTCLLQTKTLASFGNFLISGQPLSIPKITFLQSLSVLEVNAVNLYFRRLCQSVHFYMRSNKKDFFLHTISLVNKTISQELFENGNIYNGNKNTYRIYRKSICHLLIGLNHDAVSGWLMLASFLYLNKQYKTCKLLLSYCLMKCTPEKIPLTRDSIEEVNSRFNILQRQLEKIRHQSSIKKFIVRDVRFNSSSCILPEEMRVLVNDEREPTVVSPVVFGWFLTFLCNHHLGSENEKDISLYNLENVVFYEYFINSNNELAIAHALLDIAYSL